MGKIEAEVPGFKSLFFWGGGGWGGGAEVANSCLDEMGECKGRVIAFVSDWLKGLQK